MILCRYLACAVLLAAAPAGCAASGKNFKISSHPSGATIFIDGEPWGQTDAEKVYVAFDRDRMVTIRLHKDGFQPTGAVLSLESPTEMAFFLQEAPNNQKILEVLQRIRDTLDQISTQMQAAAAATR